MALPHLSPKTPPKALTLGIHLAWLTFGLSCQVSLASDGKPVIARQPATSTSTPMPAHAPATHKKSPISVKRKPSLTAPTQTARLSSNPQFVAPDPFSPSADKPKGQTLSLDSDLPFDDTLIKAIDELTNKPITTKTTPSDKQDPLALVDLPAQNANTNQIANKKSTKNQNSDQNTNQDQVSTTKHQKPTLGTPTTPESESASQPVTPITAPITTQTTTNNHSPNHEPPPIIARHSTENTGQYAPTRTSLTRLSDFYQPSTQSGSCQGSWHYPYPTEQTDGLTASANYGYYNAKNFAELSGDVIVNQNRHQIRAGKLTLNTITGQSHATGNVAFGSQASEQTISGPKNAQSSIKLSKLPQSDLMGLAERLDYNSKTGQAYAHNVAFASRSLHAHGYAKTLQQQDNKSYQLQDVIFSTCPPANRLWHIHADNIHLDKETGRGTTTHTTLNIKNVPVFYLPYFNFPIDDRRTSGFLTPNLGLNSKDGLQLSTPYYLNLSPNYDATLTPTVYTNRNPRLSAEFRYLTRQFGEGKIEGAYLPSDKQHNHKNRQHLFFDHTWQPFTDKNLTLLATYRYVSDSNYSSDFDKLGIDNSLLNLPRRLKAEYKTDNITFNARAETFQKLLGTDHLGNPILDKDRPYTRLPQLSLQYRLPTAVLQKQLSKHTANKRLSWLDTEQLSLLGTHDLAYFKKSIQDNSAIEKSGVRLYSQLSASYPFMNTWGYITPTAKLTHLFTAYDETSTLSHNLNKKNNHFNVLLPSLGLDMGVFLEKQGAPFGLTGKATSPKKSTGRQLLSPRLKYLYTPYKNQANIPNFDTTQASISYEQLLGDNWFLGYDRISDLHAITPALNYRYIDTQGKTRLDAGIAKQFYLNSPKVGLEGNIPTTIRHSELAWQLNTHPSEHLWINLVGTVNQNTPSSFIGMINYTPYANMRFGFGVIERKTNTALRQLPLSAYTASVIYPLGSKWQVLATTQYDANHKKFMDTLIGLNYEDCCIGVSVYGRQHRNALTPTEKPDHTIMAELRLNGLATSQKFTHLLKERIIGYAP